MIRIERDPAFWERVAADLTDTVRGLSPQFVGAMCALDGVMPLASERGGFIFVRRDECGFVCELHTLYHPSAWGTREITVSAKQAFNAVFIAGYQVVTTLEVQANRHSQPPRSYGFVQAGDWRDSLVGAVRMWVLTRAAWQASPCNRRLRDTLN